MNQEELKARKREELIMAYLSDIVSKTFLGISELGEEAAETVLKNSCKACVNNWLSFLAHKYGYDYKEHDFDAFLVAEEKMLKDLSGGQASLTRQDNIITEVLTPGYCACPLIKNYNLVKPFPNFCLCAKNGYRMLYEAVVKRPVKVELAETYNRGGNSCSIKIELV